MPKKKHRLSVAERRVKLVAALGEFLTEKADTGLLISELINAYTDQPLTNDKLSLLRNELRGLRNTTDFALRQIKNI